MARQGRHARFALVAGFAALAALARVERASADGNATDAPLPETAASAEAPPARAPWDFELAAKVAYTSTPIRGGTSPFGAGFGGRAGVAISGFYVGVTVVDYLGSKDVDVTDTALLYGGELGYGVRFTEAGPLTLRPRVGVGGVTVFRTDPSTSASSSAGSRSNGFGSGRGRPDVISSASGASNLTTVSAVYVEPGVTLMFAAGSFFVAADANVLVVPGISYSGAAAATWLAYGIQGQTGLRF